MWSSRPRDLPVFPAVDLIRDYFTPGMIWWKLVHQFVEKKDWSSSQQMMHVFIISAAARWTKLGLLLFSWGKVMKFSFNKSLRVYKTVVPFVPSRGQTSFLTAGVRACVHACVWTASCCSPSWTPIGQWNEKKTREYRLHLTADTCTLLQCTLLVSLTHCISLHSFFFPQRLRCTSSVSYRSSPILNILTTLMWVKYVVFKL